MENQVRKEKNEKQKTESSLQLSETGKGSNVSKSGTESKVSETGRGRPSLESRRTENLAETGVMTKPSRSEKQGTIEGKRFSQSASGKSSKNPTLQAKTVNEITARNRTRPTVMSTGSSHSRDTKFQQYRPRIQVEQKKDDKRDILTRLVQRNIWKVIENILHYLDIADLSICRIVCKEWRMILRIFWGLESTKRILRGKLDQRWMEGKYSRIEMQVTGWECQKNCQLNSRICDCDLICEVVSGSELVLLWGASSIRIERKINCGEQRSDKFEFDRGQHQVRFIIRENISLERNNYLSSPVFFKNKKILEQIKYRNVCIEVNSTREKLIIRPRPSVSAPDPSVWELVPPTGIGRPRRITSLHLAGGRLALNLESRVYVYSLAKLTDRTANPADSLLLIATRMQEPPVTFCHLAPNFLLTGGHGHFRLFQFWSGERSTGKSEFFS